jgi:excisionase family DNA binding protein
MPVKRRLLKPDAEFAQHPVVASSPRLLTIPSAAAYLSCSVWSIRNLIWKRAIPHIQIGKRFLLDRADLDSYVEKNKVRSKIGSEQESVKALILGGFLESPIWHQTPA